MDERGAVRFNMTHAKAGSPTGGQFAASPGGGGSAAKPAAKAPAAAQAASHPGGHAEKQRLLAEAHADEKRARELEKELHLLTQQHHAAVATARKAAASAKASAGKAAAAAKAGKANAHAHHLHKAAQKSHATAHKHHAHHAVTLKQRISSLKGQIHTLREHAAALEKQANAIRAAGMVTHPGGTERLHEYWVHGLGAAKIRWGEKGDFQRCVDHLGKYIHDAKGYCNLAHKAATGMYPSQHAAMDHGRAAMGKQEHDEPSRAEYMRLYALEDIHILRSADGGDGRTVEAYAAVFGEPAEIQDHEGHYIETIDPSAFSRAIDHASRARGGFPGSVKVLWNHGRDLSGAASDRFSMPIGIPVDIRAEARGLLTRTRYSETPLADEVLENIRSGSITSQSFTGRIMRSDPQLRRGDRYRPGPSGDLRTVRRTELGLREYGPVLWPAYSGAEILGVRMSTPGAYDLDPDEEIDEGTAPDDAPAAGDPLAEGEHSARYHQHALYALRSREQREKAGLVW